MTARAEGKKNENQTKKEKNYIKYNFDCWLESEDLQKD